MNLTQAPIDSAPANRLRGGSSFPITVCAPTCPYFPLLTTILVTARLLFLSKTASKITISNIAYLARVVGVAIPTKLRLALARVLRGLGRGQGQGLGQGRGQGRARVLARARALGRGRGQASDGQGSGVLALLGTMPNQ